MEAVKDTQKIVDAVEGIVKIASGGVPYWIAFGVILAIAAGLYFFIRGKIRQAAYEESERKQAKDRADSEGKSGEAEEKWDNAQKRTDEVAKENPDTGKKPRPPVESDL